MDSILKNTLNCIHEGIILSNEKFEIVFWNNYMEYLTGYPLEDVKGKIVYDILPSLDKHYFKKTFDNVLKNSYKMFFSAAIHKNLIGTERKVNFKISKIEEKGENLLVFEFIDVTNQFLRIYQLKDNVKELCLLNEELKEKEKMIHTLAYYDNLTGVANRTLFYKVANKLYHNSKRSNSYLGLMFIDVNKFKYINDTYGHKKGDEILVLVSKILESSTRDGDLVARFGGDEFLVLLPNLKSMEDVEVIVSRIIDEKNKKFKYEGIDISLSIGISLYPENGSDINELISRADEAMYVAKNKGGDNWFISSQIYS